MTNGLTKIWVQNFRTLGKRGIREHSLKILLIQNQRSQKRARENQHSQTPNSKHYKKNC